jgi:hypothetical protein
MFTIQDMETLRAYRHYVQVSNFLMASYLRVQNHLRTTVHGDENMIKEVDDLSTKCYSRHTKTALKHIAILKKLWVLGDVDGTAKECKALMEVNRRGVELSKLFESPIVGGRKGPEYYTQLEEEAESKGNTNWEFKPANYPPVDVKYLSHDMAEFRDSLRKILSVLQVVK